MMFKDPAVPWKLTDLNTYPWTVTDSGALETSPFADNVCTSTTAVLAFESESATVEQKIPRLEIRGELDRYPKGGQEQQQRA